MLFFTPLVLLTSAIGIQAASPASSVEAEMQFGKRQPLSQRPIMTSEKRSPQMDTHGAFMKRMANNDWEGLIEDAVDMVKRSMDTETYNELENVVLQTRENLSDNDLTTLTNNLQTATELFLNGDGLVIKIVGFVFGLLREAKIVDDIVKIAGKVTRVIVNKLFSIGSGSSGSSKAPAADSKAEAADSKSDEESSDSKVDPKADSKAKAGDAKADEAKSGDDA
jgi:hypothetical protein